MARLDRHLAEELFAGYGEMGGEILTSAKLQIQPILTARKKILYISVKGRNQSLMREQDLNAS